MNKKRLGLIMILLVFVSLPVLYYNLSHSLVQLGAGEGVIVGSFIGYYLARVKNIRY
jgi:hypothetical protein